MSKPYPQSPILIIDDEAEILYIYRDLLNLEGFTNLILCQDAQQALTILNNNQISVILLDLIMPQISGDDLLSIIKEDHPQIPVIVVTAMDKINTAVFCMKEGAFDYFTKPIDENRLITGIRNALRVNELEQEVCKLHDAILCQEIKSPAAFESIKTISSRMISIFKYMEVIAESPKHVLLTGESGVGKELFARVIHALSKREGELVPVNIAGLDDSLFSDTLFGHRKGAFTGATSYRRGLIEKARCGTLFLDEIGDLDNSSQTKLLRLLEEHEYYELGSDEIKTTDARIICATNSDLEAKMEKGRFRKDLYYRLITHHIHIPCLRDRKEDIHTLVDFFLDQSASTLKKRRPGIAPELYTLLATYHFPGNVRELQSIIFDAVARNDSKNLSLDFFKDYLKSHSIGKDISFQTGKTNRSMISFSGNFPTLKEIERFFIDEALKRAKGNQSIASHLLGILPSSLCRKLKKRTQN